MNVVCSCGRTIGIDATVPIGDARFAACACGRRLTIATSVDGTDRPAMDDTQAVKRVHVVIFLKGGNSIIVVMDEITAQDYVNCHVLPHLGTRRGFGKIFDTLRPSVILAMFSYEDVMGINLIPVKEDNEKWRE